MAGSTTGNMIALMALLTSTLVHTVWLLGGAVLALVGILLTEATLFVGFRSKLCHLQAI